MLKKLYTLAATLAVVAGNAMAETYLVSPQAATAAPGTEVTYNGKKYVAGTTAFGTIMDLMTAGPAESSTVNVAPGTYGDACSVTVDKLSFVGPNAYQDPRTETRTNQAYITARINVKANGTKFNGFDFKDGGQIYNTAATRQTPIDGLTFTYNVVNGSTLEPGDKVAIIKLGSYATGETAPTADVQMRYKNVNISHNIFKGAHTVNYIQIAGAAVKTTVTDNKIQNGGTSIRLDHATGVVDVKFNKFMEIGQETLAGGGSFCVQINRSAFEGTTEFNIMHNDFRKCTGQTSLYPVIRFYPGKAASTNLVTPVGCSMNIKHNVFRGKDQVHDTYNYVYYADKGTSGNVKTDIRYNVFDRNDYAFAYANRIGSDELNLWYADNYGLVDPKTSTFGTFKGATSISATTVLQSFDVDPQTGDIYYIQLSNAGTISSDPKPLYVTRLKPDGTQQRMTLVWAGHGTNMAVAYVDGKLNIFTGGRATLKTDGTETRADACCWFQFVSGATADLRKSSFTYNSKTYDIHCYDRANKNNEYPAVDEISRLFCSRTTGTGVNYFAIYDLDQVLADPDGASALSTCTIKKGDNPTTVTGDAGYNTWDHQGYTIHGDCLYIMEGVGTESSTALNGKPTLWLHIYDWKRKQFVARRQLKDATLLANTHGEPEGVKVRRNADGHAEILVGVAVGGSGARKAAIYKYTPTAGTYTLSNASHKADTEAINMSTVTGTPVTQTVTVTNTNLHGGVTAQIGGSRQFTVDKSKAQAWNTATTLTVTYTPKATEETHNAFLRVSSPMAVDMVIPMTGVNTTPSSVTDVTTETPEPQVYGNTVEGKGLINVYNLSGVCVMTATDTADLTSLPHGIYIVSNNGACVKVCR